MLTSLLSLPIRVGLRGAELGLRAGQAVAGRAIELLAPARSRATSAPARRPAPAPARRAAPEPRREGTPPESAGGDPRSAAPSPQEAVAEQDDVASARPTFTPPGSGAPSDAPSPPPPAAPPVPAPATSDHLEAEDSVVQEVADPGAEEGAGAQIHVAEPWDGYAQLKAADVVDQLTGRDAAQLAAVELYEQSHRGRKMVVEAAQRELRRTQNQP